MSTHRFKGFEDFIEIFRGGRQTDSAGNTREWSQADLDSIVAAFDAEHPAPVVIGHPKHDEPAYGWVESLKREGLKLLAKFRQVEPQFEEMVKAGRFRNRSIAIDKTGRGYALRHVGWLGAARPAIEGLKPVAFAHETPSHEFIERIEASMLIGTLRRLRDFFIEKFGLETADRVMPGYELDMMTVEEPLAATAVGPAFNAPSNPPSPPFDKGGNAPGDPAMTQQTQTFTQADIDAARTASAAEARQAAEAEFTRRQSELQASLDAERRTRLQAEFQAEVTACIDRGVAPAVLEGSVEFMLALAEGAAGEFEFTRADKSAAKLDRVAWFREHLKRLPASVKLGESGAGDAALDIKDPQAIAKRALDYQAEEAQAGRSITITQAVAHVTQAA